MMRTTVNLDDDLLERLKVRAARSRTTVGAVISDAVRSWLSHEAEPAPPFQVVTFGEGGTLPGVDLDRISELLAAEDVERYGRDRGPG